jgi:DNA invertase Pin-like site-specific DNA recombinase
MNRPEYQDASIREENYGGGRRLCAGLYKRPNPESQLLALREYADRRGFEVYKEYVDHVSGDAERRRARHESDSAYRELMKDAGRRKFDCVLVWNIIGSHVH